MSAFLKLFTASFIAAAPLSLLAATLSLSPASGTYSVGSTVSVQILLNTAGTPIEGADIRSLTYNPQLVAVLDANTAAPGIQIAPGSLMPTIALNAVDTVAGRINFSQLTAAGVPFSNTSPQVLATVNFKVLANGKAVLAIDHSAGNTRDSNVASQGKDMLTTVSGSSLILGTGIGSGKYTFTRNLKEGMTGVDVRELQKYLNQTGFVISASGAGSVGKETMYFGSLTKKALIRLQEGHTQEILTPVRLTKGTGFFGVSTRGWINSH